MEIANQGADSTAARRRIETPSTLTFAPEKLADHSRWPGSAVFHYARRLMGHAGLNTSDLDDLRQDLSIHVILQWHKFDSQRGTERTFLDRILKQKIRAILRHRRSKRRSASVEALAAEVSTDRRRPDKQDHVAIVDRRIDVASALRKLSHEEQHLARGLMTNNMSQLARLQRRHRQRLYDSWRNVKRALDEAGLRG